MNEKAVVSLTVIGFIALGIYTWQASKKEQSEWDQFSAAHGCRVVERRPSVTSIGTTFTGNGQVGITPITTPAQVAWHCNDGVTYWRSE